MVILKDLLGKQWEFSPVLWSQITHEHLELIRLRDQQYEIIILTPFSQKKSQIKEIFHREDVSDLNIQMRWEKSRNAVQITSIFSAKRLESAVVILAELERWPGQGRKMATLEQLLYVGCSRACHDLIILTSEPLPARLKQFFDVTTYTRR